MVKKYVKLEGDEHEVIESEINENKEKPNPEETLKVKEQQVLLDAKNKATAVESFLNKENFTIKQVNSYFKGLIEAIPRQANMKRGAEELFHNISISLLKEMYILGDEVGQLKSDLSRAGEISSAIIVAIQDIEQKMNELAAKAHNIIDDSTRQLSRVQKWAQGCLHDRIIQPTAGNEIITVANRLKLALNKLQEENIDRQKIQLDSLAAEVTKFTQFKTKISASNQPTQTLQDQTLEQVV